MEEQLQGIYALAGFSAHFTFLSRFLLVALALMILTRCVISLLREHYDPEIWGYLSLPNTAKIALYHWENVIGRAKNADVVMQYPSLSRNHLALIRDDKAQWTAIDLGSKAGTNLNGAPLYGKTKVKKGDVLDLGGVEVVLQDFRAEELGAQSTYRTKPGLNIWPSGTFFFLTLFQFILGLQLTLANLHRFSVQIPLGFLGMIALMWAYFLLIRATGRRGFEMESLAFLLSTIGLGVIATRNPDDVLQGLAFIAAGVVFFVIICWILRDLRWVKRFRYPIAIGGILFLAAGLVFGVEIGGATRWLRFGGFSIQPSEFVKIAFIFAGAQTLERLFSRRNLYLFIAYSAACIGILALMNDFGSAAVFFAAFLVIAFLRSGDFATIALSLASLGIGGFLALTIRPHVAARFATWGNAWESPWGVGMQQTRTMSSVASGGLFGLGAGNGVLKDVVAADTDMVFGIVAEELGLIVAFICIVSIIVLGIFSIRSATSARSSFYVITAGAAVTMFLTQITLNVFGSLDIIPFTGMTFPFVSRGGSSMVASWGLLAFIKATDNRQNASITVKRNRKAEKAYRRASYAEDIYDESEYETEAFDDYEPIFEDEYDDIYETQAEQLEGGIDPWYFDDNR